MRTREIDKSQWTAECDQFSRLHRDQRASVQSLGKEFGVQAVARNLPLLGVTAEARDRGGLAIQVMTGESPDAFVAHVIPRPAKLRLAEWNDDVSAAMQIEADDGTVTLVEVGPQKELLRAGCVVDDLVHPPAATPRRSSGLPRRSWY